MSASGILNMHNKSIYNLKSRQSYSIQSGVSGARVLSRTQPSGKSSPIVSYIRLAFRHAGATLTCVSKGIQSANRRSIRNVLTENTSY